LRFYAPFGAAAESFYHNIVSTLLEILQHDRRGARRRLRRLVSTLLEILHPDEFKLLLEIDEAMFQPFLRFYEEIRRCITHNDVPCVSTLLEILLVMR